MFPSYNPYNSFNAFNGSSQLAQLGGSYGDFSSFGPEYGSSPYGSGGYGGNPFGSGNSPFGSSGYGSNSYGSGGTGSNPFGSGGTGNSLYGSGGYGSNSYGSGSNLYGSGGYGSGLYGYGSNLYGSGGYGSSLGYGNGMMMGTGGNPILQGFENYLMTTSRVSNLIQMSMQGVSMTVQSAFQLAQSGMMLQQQHATLNGTDTTTTSQPTPKSLDGPDRVQVEDITAQNKGLLLTHENKIKSPSLTDDRPHTRHELPFSPHELHSTLTTIDLPWFLQKLFGLLDTIDSYLSFLPTPPSIVRLITMSAIDTVINFFRRVTHLYNFSHSPNFNYTSIYTMYLQYRLLVQAQKTIRSTTTTNPTKNEQDKSDLGPKDGLFEIYQENDIKLIVIHTLVAKNYVEMTKEVLIEHSNSSVPEPFAPKPAPINSFENLFNNAIPAQTPTHNSKTSPISPIVTSLLANHRSFYNTQSRQQTQNSKLQDVSYQIMQTQTPSRLWWLIGALLFCVGVQATVSIIKELRSILNFLFPTIFPSSSDRHHRARTPQATLTQNELYQRWLLLSPEEQSQSAIAIPLNFKPSQSQSQPQPRSLDDIWFDTTPSLATPHQQQPQHLMRQPNTHSTTPNLTGGGGAYPPPASGAAPFSPDYASLPINGLNPTQAQLMNNGLSGQYPVQDPSFMGYPNDPFNQSGMAQHQQQLQQQRLRSESSWPSRLSSLITMSLVCGTGWIVYKAFVIANNEMKRYHAAQQQQQQLQRQQERPQQSGGNSTPSNGEAAAPAQNAPNGQQIPLFNINDSNNNNNMARMNLYQQPFNSGFGMNSMNTMASGLGYNGGFNSMGGFGINSFPNANSGMMSFGGGGGGGMYF